MVPRISRTFGSKRKYSWISRVPKISETEDFCLLTFGHTLNVPGRCCFFVGCGKCCYAAQAKKSKKKQKTKIAIVGCSYLEVLSWKSKGAAPHYHPAKHQGHMSWIDAFGVCQSPPPSRGISHGCLQLLLYGVWCFEGGMVEYDGL